MTNQWSENINFLLRIQPIGSLMKSKDFIPPQYFLVFDPNKNQDHGILWVHDEK